MGVGVIPDLVAGSVRRFHQLWKPFRHIAKEKTCYFNLIVVKDIEELSKISLHTGRERVPLADLRRSGHIENMEPVFYVYAEYASYRWHGPSCI